MFVRLSAAIAVVSLLSSLALAEDAKLTDPQIAHIAYTAGVIDIAAAKQALTQASNKGGQRALNRDDTACAGGQGKSIANYPERLHHRTRDIARVETDRIGM